MIQDKPVVRCENCEHEWDHDPTLNVDCPMCKAPKGNPCNLPTGFTPSDSHADRTRKAQDEGHFYHYCSQKESK